MFYLNYLNVKYISKSMTEKLGSSLRTLMTQWQRLDNHSYENMQLVMPVMWRISWTSSSEWRSPNRLFNSYPPLLSVLLSRTNHIQNSRGPCAPLWIRLYEALRGSPSLLSSLTCKGACNVAQLSPYDRSDQPQQTLAMEAEVVSSYRKGRWNLTLWAQVMMVKDLWCKIWPVILRGRYE